MTTWTRAVAVTCVLLILVVAAFAAEAPTADPKTPAFEVSVTFTAKADELFESWDHPTGKSFQVEAAKVAPRGKFHAAVVLFKGCQPDSSGDCDATMDIVVHDPHGRVYGELRNVELWQKKPAPQPGYSQLSRTYMGVVVEASDAPGTYLVSVRARDLHAKVEAKSETTFQVE